ncbi:MAG: 3-hydroxyacyl-ACP dehydratase FabZ [Gammaproteobacteria bacterium]|nr:3-hydroxyacyl-ACP dehydratase FabZ [Gammaproteobacteria bacterium]
MSKMIAEMDALSIREALPHRYPFLMIDRITGGVIGESIAAVKNVSNNEPYFQGHFPGRPVMPGVMIIEAMAQAGGVLSYLTLIDLEPKPLFFLAGVDNARFRQTVLPGDQLEVRVDVERVRRGIWFYRCEASVDGRLAVSANVTCAPGGER